MSIGTKTIPGVKIGCARLCGIISSIVSVCFLDAYCTLGFLRYLLFDGDSIPSS
jgi:hypothetical protein